MTTTTTTQIVRRSQPAARVRTRESVSFRRLRALLLVLFGATAGAVIGILIGTGVIGTVAIVLAFIGALAWSASDIRGA